jgi:hypothetical protein
MKRNLNLPEPEKKNYFAVDLKAFFGEMRIYLIFFSNGIRSINLFKIFIDYVFFFGGKYSSFIKL